MAEQDGLMGMNPQLIQLAMLAGIGLTQLPKLQSGMSGGGGKKAAAAGAPAGAEALGPLLQALAAKRAAQQGQGGAQPSESSGEAPVSPKEIGPPAVPRFPTPPVVSAKTSPAIPRVAPMDAS